MDLRKWLVRGTKRLPFVEDVLRWRHHRRFLSEAGYALHYGVYESFAEARLAAPPSREFDRPELAAEYIHRLSAVFAYDYPVMFWLDRALREGARSVLDVGGNIGVHYFAYQRYIQHPAGMSWTVCEVPEIVTAGSRLASERAARGLAFSRPHLLNAMAVLGYDLVDAWPVPERHYWIPGHPEKSFGSYSGVYFRGQARP